MDLRREFCALASQDGANVSALCRRYGISRKTGHKWLKRWSADGQETFADRSRRPKSAPKQTPAAVEAAVVALRGEHPAWGGRKLQHRLKALWTPQPPAELGPASVPSASTITAILRRHGALEAAEAAKHTAFTSFEHDRPNALWQMDFKGHFALADGQRRCHPLTVLDDHSRFSLCLAACADERWTTVREHLIATFERYGLPERMTMDNGAPWGDGPDSPYTVLTVWLMRLGIRIGHSRPYHPQTQGKDERFHRSLKAEVIARTVFADLADCQRRFDDWRTVYNTQRPHQALAFQTPATRYQPSPRSYPGLEPELEYAPDDQVRHVQQGGVIHFQGGTIKVSKAFANQPVALRPTAIDGTWDIIFAAQRIAQVNLGDALR